VYEIDEAAGGGNGTTTLGHGNIISLNHQAHHFDDDPMWSTTVPAKRGRRPKSTAVVITTAPTPSSIQKPEPKRRGRKPKQEILSPTKSLSSTNINNNNNNNNNLNDILSESTEDINQKQQRRSTLGMRSNKKLKNEEQLSGKLIKFYRSLSFRCFYIKIKKESQLNRH
jgi:hypothetical protein